MDSLNAYARALDTALKKRQPYAAYNRDMAHAEIVVCTALAHAQHEVLLLSERLDATLYAGPWFDSALHDFITRGGTIKILVESDIPEDHAIRRLASDIDTIHIRKVSHSMVSRYDFNFMVVDDSGYRFETSRSEPRAVVIFNSDAEGERNKLAQAKALFNLLWENWSERI